MPASLSNTRSFFAVVGLSLSLMTGGCARTLADFEPPHEEKSEGVTHVLGRIYLEYMGLDLTSRTSAIFAVGDDEIRYQLDGTGLVAFETGTGGAARIVSLEFRSEDELQTIPLDAALPDIYERDSRTQCFGVLTVRATKRYVAKQKSVERIIFKGEGQGEKYDVPDGVDFEYTPQCSRIIRELARRYEKKKAPPASKPWLPSYLSVADPLRAGRFPQKSVPLVGLGGEERWVPIWSRVHPCTPTDRASAPGPSVRVLDVKQGSGNDKQRLWKLLDDAGVLGVALEDNLCLMPGGPEAVGRDPLNPHPVSSTSQASAIVARESCGDSKFEEIVVDRASPGVMRIQVLCADLSEAGEFYFKLPISSGAIGKPCRLQTQCGGDICERGLCTRKCRIDDDCGDKAVCGAGSLCRLRCTDANGCPEGSICSDTANGGACLPDAQPESGPVRPQGKR